MSGSRGPLSKPNAMRRGGRSSPAALTTLATTLEEAPPDDLGEVGAVVWQLAGACSWVQASDAYAVHRLAQLEDEREMLARRVAEDGPLLERPIVTPRGEIAGSDCYAHPLLTELRRLDTRLDKLRAELGLSPMARARLGVRVAEGETLLARLLREDAEGRRARGIGVDPRALHPLEDQ